MSESREPFVVTGLGALSAAGRGCEALWAAARSGEDRLAPIRRFASNGELAGVVPGWDDVHLVAAQTNREAQALCREFAVVAAAEALADAGIVGVVAPRRIAVVLGTNIVDRPQTYAQMVAAIADELGLRGPRISVSTACASGTTALGVAHELLALGCADAVLVGGADALTPLLFTGFRTLRMLAPARCAPFSAPVGTSLGEGAGFVVLEPLAHARARGRAPALALAGHGFAADAFQATRPDPQGGGLVRCLGGALRHAGVDAAEVVYLNAHGTGTDANDEAECRGLERVFGARTPTLPVSASKSLLGHAQGAAGALETVLMLRARRDGLVPATLHFAGLRPGCALDVVGEGVPRVVAGDVVAKYSAGFGGANAAVVFASVEREPPPRLHRPIWLAGDAHANGHTGASDERITADPLTRALTAAVAAAIADAGLVLRRDDGAAVGLFVAQPRVSPVSYHRLIDAAERRGLDRLSTTALVRTLLVAPAGACCETLDLRGPLCVFAGDTTGLLLPLVLAAQQLAGRPELACMLVAAAAEDSDAEADATCLALTASPGPLALAGWGLAAGGDPAAARAAALARAGLADDVAVTTFTGTAQLPSLLTALRTGAQTRALWLADDPAGVCGAALLIRDEAQR